LATGLLLVPGPSFAQAPTGPQGGQQQPQGSPPQQPPAPKPPDAQQGGATISVEVPIVTLDVVATTQRGDILTGLKRENFKITDEGVPQTITNFAPTDSPITAVVLMEFSATFYGWFSYQAKYWADALFPQLQQKDWIALKTFDMKTRLEQDFTQNKDEVRNALYHLYFPGFSESNVFDALLETVDQLKDVKGKKSILLLASGIDTFSKHTLDQTMKELRQSDTTVFVIGVDRPISNWMELHARRAGPPMSFLQAENQMKTFAQLTGGKAWFPQFDGELPGIMQEVAAFLRHQYSLSYSPSNGAADGKFHKVKIELVAPDGGPLTVLDQKGKKQKYVVYAREGYQAPKGAVGD
jgi:VWFA-related protein